MLIIYLAVLIATLYWVTKILLPEMAKPTLPAKKPVPKSMYIPQSAAASDNRIEKLEILLAEKNKNIQVLQSELTIFLVQVREFDKIKAMLEEEIHRLREQNRIFRSELGLPAAQPKESSIT